MTKVATKEECFRKIAVFPYNLQNLRKEGGGSLKKIFFDPYGLSFV